MSPKQPFVVDDAEVDRLLKELRMPTMKDMWRPFADRARREGWSHDRYLAQLAEQELADRARRRFERHRAEAKLPPGKSLDNFDFGRLPGLSERLVRVLANGGDWIDDGHNVVVLGPPGTGKSHLAAGIGLALVERGYRVLYARATDLVQKLQAARRDLALEAAIRRLHKFHLVVLDDIAYVDKDRNETSALFELVGTRYEYRSLLVTTNQPFSAWERIFADKAMTIAAVDRLVHHAHILTPKARAAADKPPSNAPATPPEPTTRVGRPAGCPRRRPTTCSAPASPHAQPLALTRFHIRYHRSGGGRF